MTGKPGSRGEHLPLSCSYLPFETDVKVLRSDSYSETCVARLFQIMLKCLGRVFNGEREC